MPRATVFLRQCSNPSMISRGKTPQQEQPISAESSSHLPNGNVTQRSSSGSSTTPPVVATTTSTNPRVTINNARRWTPFCLFICCASTEYTVGHHYIIKISPVTRTLSHPSNGRNDCFPSLMISLGETHTMEAQGCCCILTLYG
ncbi:hypothetical protein BDR06DRAFT_950225 [Suillus hirtellus]|nr:hypothetical protein BDR06DRAFT_950225 [Suillus hirtellus]